MRMKIITFIVCLVLFITCSIGCVEQESEHENIENLTDIDWEYFQFHYSSGKDLDRLFRQGVVIINEEIAVYNPANSSFLLEVNSTNHQSLSHLINISITILKNVSSYQIILQNYSTSSYFTNHKIVQENIFSIYKELSYVYLIAYDRIEAAYINSNSSNNTEIYVDISDTMISIFSIEESINENMSAQVNHIVTIPEDIWSQWDEKDWSFME